MSNTSSGGNVIAALCNIFFPGLGQLVQGRILAALLFAIFFFGGAALWFLVVPGIIAAIVYVWAIIDAARYRSRD
jgi:TM2 domain-containing membrane protein YozV